MRIDTSGIRFQGSGRSTITAEGGTGGINLAFTSETPGLGATVMDSLTTSPQVIRLSMPMQFKVPVSFDGGGSTSGFAVHIDGLTGAGATYWSEELKDIYPARYSYRLTIDAQGGGDTGTLKLLDTVGDIPINGPTPATLSPQSWDALVPAGFALQGLTATLSLGLSYRWLGGFGSNMWEPLGPLKEGSAIASITSLSIQAIPEPGTCTLMALGLLGLAAARRRQR